MYVNKRKKIVPDEPIRRFAPSIHITGRGGTAPVEEEVATTILSSVRDKLEAPDDGGTFDFDIATLAYLPLAAALSVGWVITVTNTSGESGYLYPQGDDFTVVKMDIDGTNFDNIEVTAGANLTITFDGTEFDVTGTGANGQND